ncbi:tribbles homolog 2 [Diabrotica virgifera virgifera]|uniref:Protein kinase domain-containing protein n=1 Tax=Diabrotica virgifera virgifera TaxID=50390 RepID=A0ABM5KXW3_DIAVI|nr:tribbles homolog 2 [Diabrotica virgifera virgifera]
MKRANNTNTLNSYFSVVPKKVIKDVGDNGSSQSSSSSSSQQNLVVPERLTTVSTLQTSVNNENTLKQVAVEKSNEIELVSLSAAIDKIIPAVNSVLNKIQVCRFCVFILKVVQCRADRHHSDRHSDQNFVKMATNSKDLIVSRESHSLVSAHYKLDFHPRISSIHEVIARNRYLYLVFPKAHGDLHSYVRSRKRLRESEAKKLFRQIAETVQVCHENGIVLRDLKLRKFVFADQQKTELKLESLEDAVVLEEPDSDWLHDKRGCPAYVSPEILKAGAHYSGKAADMWSLGVILYTMLVGRYPFNDSEHASLFAKISRGHFVIPECLSSRARCLIRSLLRREPSERITSSDILYHPWLVKEDKDWSSRSCDQLVPECSLYDD